jgi:hypothetical protein
MSTDPVEANLELVLDWIDARSMPEPGSLLQLTRAPAAAPRPAPLGPTLAERATLERRARVLAWAESAGTSSSSPPRSPRASPPARSR